MIGLVAFTPLSAATVAPGSDGSLPGPFAHQLPNVQVPSLPHLCGPRVPKVRVVLPYLDLDSLALPLQIGRERRERLGHVAVAQVPR